MKRIGLIFILLLYAIIGWTQTQYEVTANTFLNIRSQPANDAPVIATIGAKEVVNVFEINGQWAKISHADGFAYVSADYLKPVSQTIAAEASSKFDINSLWKGGDGNFRWMIYVILALSLALLVIRKVRGEDEPLENGLYVCNWVVFLITCLFEIAYVKSMGTNAIWFCIPDRVGWLWTIINFVLFGFVVYNQCMCLFNTLRDVQYNSYASFDWRCGIYSWGISIVAAIVCGIFFQPALVFVGILFLIAQIVQVIIILKKVIPSGGWWTAVLCVLVYLAGTVATVAILAHFLVLLIIVLIGLFILSILGKSSSSSSRCCSNCSHSSGGYCSYKGRYISDPDRKICDNYS